MYPEFIAIYVGLGVLAVLLAAAIVLLILVLKKVSNSSGSRNGLNPVIHSGASETSSANGATVGGVVFCKKCMEQFSASANVCPKCGTAR